VTIDQAMLARPIDAERVTREDVLRVCGQARDASRALRELTRADKDRVLEAMAAALVAQAPAIADANRRDLDAGQAAGLSQALLDRLLFDQARVSASAAALRVLAGLPDPVGEVVRGQRLANGLEVRQTRVPMGVVAMVYEARPNVTIDAAGLAFKSGNSVVLRGGSAAAATNRELVRVLRSALVDSGLPADAVVLIDGGGRDVVQHLMTARGYVDVLIPRGGAGLIRAVVEGSTVPVIETGVGNCHVYVDASADIAKAVRIVLNSKTHRPGVCNAAETLLVHRAAAPSFLAEALPALAAAGVRLHVDPAVADLAGPAGVPVTEVTPMTGTASTWRST
jgi:glutamate-5-semialdehyde dehydrogenase